MHSVLVSSSFYCNYKQLQSNCGCDVSGNVNVTSERCGPPQHNSKWKHRCLTVLSQSLCLANLARQINKGSDHSHYVMECTSGFWLPVLVPATTTLDQCSDVFECNLPTPEQSYKLAAARFLYNPAHFKTDSTKASIIFTQVFLSLSRVHMLTLHLHNQPRCGHCLYCYGWCYYTTTLI